MADNREEQAAIAPIPGLGAKAAMPDTRDPWQHRARGMKCATCMWWVAKGDRVSTNGKLGRCRRHAPSMGGYPATFEQDWCGDHKLDETKL